MINLEFILRTRLIAAVGLLVAASAFSGCQSDFVPPALRENAGLALTSEPGEQLDPQMFVGKWDEDGERTNAVNGRTGVTTIPSDIAKDVLGKGWRLEPDGRFESDALVGAKEGTWQLAGKNTLVLHREGRPVRIKYKAAFMDGFLYLRRPNGSWIVMERDKFFGI